MPTGFSLRLYAHISCVPSALLACLHFILFATGCIHTVCFVTTTLLLIPLDFSVYTLAPTMIYLHFYQNFFVLPACTEMFISVAALHQRPSATPPTTHLHTFCFARTATNFLWPPYVIGGAIIFLPCSFFFLSIYLFSFISSPNLSGRRLDVYHTLTHGVALVRI